MTTRTYRFTVTGTITVDDETLKRGFIGMDLQRFLEETPPRDDVLDVQRHRMDTIAQNPLPVILQSYLGTGYLWRYENVVKNWILEDMPDAEVTFAGIDVVDVASDDN